MEIVKAKRPYIKWLKGSVFLDVFHGVTIDEWGGDEHKYQVCIVMKNSQNLVLIGKYKTWDEAISEADKVMELASSFNPYQSINNLFQ